MSNKEKTEDCRFDVEWREIGTSGYKSNMQECDLSWEEAIAFIKKIKRQSHVFKSTVKVILR